nr:MAG TPA: hypothetical protein [Caudoviricetes sp.]
MQSIHIISDHGKVSVIIDGAKLDRLHSFSVDYVEGAPLLISCVADVGEISDSAPKIVH